MVRIDRGTAQGLINFFNQHMGEDAKRIFDQNARDYDGASFDKFMQNLADQVYNDQHIDNGPLIEQMVDILQSNMSRNILSGNTLADLKATLLLPSERNKLLETIRQGLSCTVCGAAMQDGELGVVKMRGSGPEVYCTRCTMPTKMAGCTHSGCKVKAEIHPAVIKQLQKRVDCGGHEVPTASDVPAAAISFDVETPLATIERMTWAEIMARGPRGGVALAPPGPPQAAQGRFTRAEPLGRVNATTWTPDFTMEDDE